MFPANSPMAGSRRYHKVSVFTKCGEMGKLIISLLCSYLESSTLLVAKTEKGFEVSPISSPDSISYR